MGHGDFKFFATCGAWFGTPILLSIIMMASIVGAVVGILGILFKFIQREDPIPFGPYIALAAWIALVWSDSFPMVNPLF